MVIATEKLLGCRTNWPEFRGKDCAVHSSAVLNIGRKLKGDTYVIVEQALFVNG